MLEQQYKAAKCECITHFFQLLSFKGVKYDAIFSTFANSKQPKGNQITDYEVVILPLTHQVSLYLLVILEVTLCPSKSMRKYTEKTIYSKSESDINRQKNHQIF